MVMIRPQWGFTPRSFLDTIPGTLIAHWPMSDEASTFNATAGEITELTGNSNAAEDHYSISSPTTNEKAEQFAPIANTGTSNSFGGQCLAEGVGYNGGAYFQLGNATGVPAGRSNMSAGDWSWFCFCHISSTGTNGPGAGLDIIQFPSYAPFRITPSGAKFEFLGDNGGTTSGFSVSPWQLGTVLLGIVHDHTNTIHKHIAVRNGIYYEINGVDVNSSSTTAGVTHIISYTKNGEIYTTKFQNSIYTNAILTQSDFEALASFIIS